MILVVEINCIIVKLLYTCVAAVLCDYMCVYACCSLAGQRHCD